MRWNLCRPQKERQAVNDPPSVQSGRHRRERQHFCRAAFSALCDQHYHVMPTAGLIVQARCTQCISADRSPPSGIVWEGSNYYERFLPFSLRSSPAFFDSVATAVNWIMQHEFAKDHHLHYLEEFLHISTGLVAANQQLTIPLRAFTYLGIPPCYIQA